MNRNLRAREDAFERDHAPLPLAYWDALCGAIPVEQLDPPTRKLFEAMFEDAEDDRDRPDSIEARIAEAMASAAD